jgi:molybdopterin-containing oxidoreductase family iron-sulfur binding subunit
MRGVVEKCNFCHGRWHAAKAKAVANGKTAIDPADYIPACVEACPSGAIRFGNLNDSASEAAGDSHLPTSFRLLESLGTDPKIYYRSTKPWVKKIANAPRPGAGKETARG